VRAAPPGACKRGPGSLVRRVASIASAADLTNAPLRASKSGRTSLVSRAGPDFRVADERSGRLRFGNCGTRRATMLPCHGARLARLLRGLRALAPSPAALGGEAAGLGGHRHTEEHL